MSDKMFTITFKGDITAFDKNPLHMRSIFGEAVTCCDGNVFARADILEARIEELEVSESELSDLAHSRCVEKEFIEDENRTLRYRIDMLERALKPFANRAHSIEPICPDDAIYGFDITVGDLRAAAAAIRDKNDG